MSDLTHQVVARLYHGGEFSRNRNFYAYTDPGVMRGRRLFRHLSSLAADMRKAGRAKVRHHVGRDGERGFHVVVRLHRADATRVAFVTEREMVMLCEETDLRSILEAGGLARAWTHLDF